MKKAVLAACFCGVIGLMGLSLFGCTPIIKDHEIFLTSSDFNNAGTVSGYGTYKTGANVTIKAIPKAENGFLAWIKDESIVSYDAEYSFTASSKTEGKYTALFATDRFEFARLTGVTYSVNSFTVPNQDVTLNELSLTYNNISTLQKNLASYGEYILETNNNNTIADIEYEDKVLFINQSYTFNLTLSLSYTSIETGDLTSTEPLTTKFTIDFSQIFSPNAQKDGNTTTFSSNDYTLTLINETTTSPVYYLTVEFKNLKQSDNYWDNTDQNNQQLLTMSFVYQNPLGE